LIKTKNEPEVGSQRTEARIVCASHHWRWKKLSVSELRQLTSDYYSTTVTFHFRYFPVRWSIKTGAPYPSWKDFVLLYYSIIKDHKQLLQWAADKSFML